MHELMLYRKNSFGIGTWRVGVLEQNESRAKIFVAHTVSQGGSEVVHTSEIVRNGSGRTIAEQIALEINSRVNRQLDKGYKHSRLEAEQGSTNQLGLANPMLALPLEKVTLRGSHFNEAYVQPKLDGHRCLITKQNGDLFAYTRKGKPITTIPHILDDCDRWMQDGDTLDGELYSHGHKLQSISSWIKRDQPESRLLQYHWYDMIVPKPFGERHRLINDLAASIDTTSIDVVPTTRVAKMSEVYELFRKFRADGYEGAMLRLSIAGYEDGKRVMQLIKVKERLDGEVRTIGVRASADGWAILRVRFDAPPADYAGEEATGRSVEFDISAPGSVSEKTEVLRNYTEKYHDRLLTIEYAMLTTDGVPFHAVATRWREDL